MNSIVKCNAGKVKEAIKICDEEIEELNICKLDAILYMKTTEKVDKIDAEITFYDLQLSVAKLEKQLYLALGKQNWRLLTLIRVKIREQCDMMMEHIENAVEKGWMDESLYIKTAKGLKDVLDEIDGIRRELESWGVVI